MAKFKNLDPVIKFVVGYTFEELQSYVKDLMAKTLASNPNDERTQYVVQQYYENLIRLEGMFALANKMKELDFYTSIYSATMYDILNSTVKQYFPKFREAMKND